MNINIFYAVQENGVFKLKETSSGWDLIVSPHGTR